MTDARNLIPAGPGFVGDPTYPNELSADVELELVYGPKGNTAAGLILTATDIEGGKASLTVGVELTRDDLLSLRNWCDAMAFAALEDEVGSF